MKKLTAIAILLAGLCLPINAQTYTTPTFEKITTLKIIGDLWTNDNKGGVFFTTTNQPTTIELFIIRVEAKAHSEVYFDRLYSMLLAAKMNSKSIKMDYTILPGYPKIGDIVAIELDPNP